MVILPVAGFRLDPIASDDLVRGLRTLSYRPCEGGGGANPSQGWELVRCAVGSGSPSSVPTEIQAPIEGRPDVIRMRVPISLLASACALAGGVVALGPSTAQAALASGCSASGAAISCVYGYTGAEQTFTVPANVETVSVVAVGAAGATGIFSDSGPGGRRRARRRGQRDAVGLTG